MKKHLLLNSLLDLISLIIGFLFMAWIKPGAIEHVIAELWLVFVIFSVIWIVISLISGKYLDTHKKSMLQLYNGVLIADFTLLILTIIGLLIFKPPYGNLIVAIGTGGIAFVLELIFATYLFFHYKYQATTGKQSFTLKPVSYPDIVDPNKEQEQKVKPGSSRTPKEFELREYEPIIDESLSAVTFVYKRIKSTHEFLYDLIDRNIPLNSIKRSNAQILNTRTLFNIQTVEKGTSDLFINLHRINDIRRINQFLIQVNINLNPGGYFVGCALTKEERKSSFFQKFKPPLGWILYCIDFVIRRLLPKTPGFKELFFAITNGENRIISRSEVLGRLFFCGFELVETSRCDDYFYFIMQKVSEHREDPNPSYGPFIKMRRVSKGGELINVYKFRTMHPYSEYVQDYIYRTNALDDSGKFRNDYRVTTWGRIFRRMWIDELPQLLNLYRGQLKLVGVRALSQHYFGLYPEWLQDLRIKAKPGLIPPYYMDQPQTFEEICESERKYLEAYLKRPLLTDWKYFWGAMYNIVIKRVRSK
jgi:lipopolysaccharide/colanic/teichoic acid biosynthesis glycosyltransferase